jgi:hypothetical protein
VVFWGLTCGVGVVSPRPVRYFDSVTVS